MNMKLNKKNIFGFLAVTSLALILAFQFTGGYSSKATFIVNDRSLADGDTFRSGWYDISGAENVAVTFEVSDSVTARADFFYRYGPGGATVACIPISDSIGIQNEGGASYSAKQNELRGYGMALTRVRAAGDTVNSLIPGANQIQVKITVGDVNSDGTAGNNQVKVGVITAD